MFKKNSYVLIIYFFSAISGQTIEIEKALVSIKQNEVLFKVKGLVCSFCAQGLTKSLSKLDFIDKEKYKKGVYVDIENQYTIVAIKENSEIKLVPEMLNLLGCSKDNFKKLLQKMNYKIFEKENETFFKYNPTKKFKKITTKKISNENPFKILKNLNLG